MQNVILELRIIINEFPSKLQSISDSAFAVKPHPHQWSKQEILGHLIDSASNNLRRFICGQYEPEPPHVVYNQDFWVYANQYQQAKPADLITLWKLLNERVLAVWQQMPEEHYANVCDTGRQTSSLHTMEWLARDYVRHLKHHLNHLVPGSFEVTYP